MLGSIKYTLKTVSVFLHSCPRAISLKVKHISKKFAKRVWRPVMKSRINLLLVASRCHFRLFHAHHINNPLHLLSYILIFQKD